MVGFARKRRERLPADVAAALDLRGRERVIAWGSGAGADGRPTYVVATDRALHLPDDGTDVRVPWDLVERAAWADGVLDLALRPEPGAKPRRRVVALDDEQELPVVVRERVTASIEVQQHLDLAGTGGPGGAVTGGIVVAARRVSDTGELRWSVAFDEGTEGRDPAVRAAASRALADLRAALGL